MPLDCQPEHYSVISQNNRRRSVVDVEGFEPPNVGV